MFLSKNIFLSYLNNWKYGIPLFYQLSVIAFWNNFGTSFTDDSLEWIVYFQKYGWDKYWQSYEMTSIYWMHDLFSNIMYLVFDKNSFAWYFIILFFHTTATYFWYRFLFIVLEDSKIKNAVWISLLSAFIFMTGAYHSENILWIATYHYTISLLYLTFGLYVIADRKANLILSDKFILFVPFPFMLTMHEIVFFFPFAFFAVLFFYNDYQWGQSKLKSYFLFMLPYGLASLAILVLTKAVKGSFIPHYGAGHIQNHSLYGFLYTLFNYVEKHFLFVHNMPYHLKEKLYDIDKSTMIIFFISSFVLIALYGYYLRNRKNIIKLYVLFILLLLILFIPFSNMYFYWHFPFQNDRLGYYFSLVASTLFAFFLITQFKQVGIALSIIFIAINFYFLRYNIYKIESAHYFYHKLLTPSYEPYLNKKPVVLNLPYNYNGVYVYRHKLRMPSSLYFFYQKNIDYTYVLSTPFFSSTDSIIPTKISDSVYKITLAVPGGWLMNEAMGGSDYENEKVRVDYADDNQSAYIYLQQYDKTQPILYCTGSKGFVKL